MKKFYGVIYLMPTKLEMTIYNLSDFTVITRVSSELFIEQKNLFEVYQSELEKIVKTLNYFKQVLAEYGVNEFHFWANRQIIDIVSARYLADQIKVRTGFKLSWLNQQETSYYKVIAVMARMEKFEKIIENPTYLLNLGSSKITLSFFKNKRFIASWNVDIEYPEVVHIIDTLRQTIIDPIDVLDDFIGSKLDSIKNEFESTVENVNLIIQGAGQLNKLILKHGDISKKLSLKRFNQIYNETIRASDQYLGSYFKTDEKNLKLVTLHLSIINKIIKYTKANNAYLTKLTVRAGLAYSVLNSKKLQLSDLTYTAAENIAKRYNTNSKHRDSVLKFALHLFDRLKKVHGLGNDERRLLELACVVEDIGNFINQHGHYRHSAYILEANKLIGLSDEQSVIISEITRYHSSEIPEENQSYRKLPSKIQLIVAKLASILRLADSLDDSRKQYVKKISVSLKNEIIITAYSNQNLALEKWAFSNKSKLFREVYGIKPILKQRSSNNG